MNKNKLPIFELFYLPDESNKIGMESVSLVDAPAIEANFIYFDKDIVKLNFSSDEEMIVKGPALIPDQLIFRNADNRERYIFFSKETIKKFAMSFLSRNNQKVNIDHSNKFIDTNIVESYFITDANNEFDVPVGTWIVAMHINDVAIWNDVKNGKYKGFSIQGMFAEELEQNFKSQLKLSENMTLKEKLINAINTILFDESDDDMQEPMVPSGETKPEEFAEETPIVEPVVEPVIEPKVEPEVKLEEAPVEPVVEPEVKPEVITEVITEDKIQELITKSQSETIDKLSKMIDDLNKKIDEFGNSPIPSNKKEEQVDAPRSISSGAARFAPRK